LMYFVQLRIAAQNGKMPCLVILPLLLNRFATDRQNQSTFLKRGGRITVFGQILPCCPFCRIAGILPNKGKMTRQNTRQNDQAK